MVKTDLLPARFVGYRCPVVERWQSLGQTETEAGNQTESRSDQAEKQQQVQGQTLPQRDGWPVVLFGVAER